MKSIMIDMDDVIVSGGLLYLINEFLGTDYKESDFKDFYMQDVVPDKEKFFKWFVTKNLYDYCTMKSNACEVIQKLNEHYNVYIGTSYIYREIPEESGIFLMHKYNYLIKKLPFLLPKSYIFLSDKSILNCDIKIDDRIDNLEGAKIKILYTAYHNKDISDSELNQKGIVRADNWLEIEKLLLE